MRIAGRRGRLRSFDPEQAAHAALRVFWEHGYEGATLTALKAAMGGICSPSLYAAFGSKEALFLKALALYWDEELMPVLAVLDQRQGPQAVHEFLRQSVLRYTDEAKPKGCLVDLGMVNYSSLNRGIQGCLQSVREEVFRRVRDCLAKAQRQGYIAPATDLERLARILIVLRQGLSSQARDGATREQLLGVVEDAADLWRRASSVVPASG